LDGLTDLGKIKHPSGKNNYKWPNLDELYHYLFGIRFDNPHDAINDVNACKQCFFEMKKRFFTVFDD
jgi:DNA polymerase III epsilon subunit-like protein